MDRPAQPDRYEPLPPLLQIPGFLVRKMSPRAKRLALLALALAAVAVAVGVPSLIATKDHEDAVAARNAARAEAARIAALRAEIRQVDGRGTPSAGLAGASALATRHALVGDLVGAIEADAARRLRAGEFDHAVKHVDCSRYPAAPGIGDPAGDLKLSSGRYACLAVTADFSRATETLGGAIGYPYRALVHFGSGRFAF